MLIRIREFRNGPRGRWLVEQIVGMLGPCLSLRPHRFAPAAFLLLPDRTCHHRLLIPVHRSGAALGRYSGGVRGISGVAAPAFFFYPPYYDFRVHNPAQIADIVLFMAVATMTGRWRHRPAGKDARAGRKPA